MTEEILAARLKWIKFLKDPTTKRATGKLVSATNHEARCCLGHACHVLDIPYNAEMRQYDGSFSYPPDSLISKLGLWNQAGGIMTDDRLAGQYSTLANWNDVDVGPTTQQDIGAYLETVICGGPSTPFKPVDEAIFNCCTNNDPPDWDQFDGFELGGCIDDDGVTIGGIEKDKAEFFTIYGHLKTGGVEAITDLKDFELAELVMNQFSTWTKLPTSVVC